MRAHKGACTHQLLTTMASPARRWRTSHHGRRYGENAIMKVSACLSRNCFAQVDVAANGDCRDSSATRQSHREATAIRSVIIIGSGLPSNRSNPRARQLRGGMLTFTIPKNTGVFGGSGVISLYSPCAAASACGSTTFPKKLYRSIHESLSRNVPKKAVSFNP